MQGRNTCHINGWHDVIPKSNKKSSKKSVMMLTLQALFRLHFRYYNDFLILIIDMVPVVSVYVRNLHETT